MQAWSVRLRYPYHYVDPLEVASGAEIQKRHAEQSLAAESR
jgi:hypothetical protein